MNKIETPDEWTEMTVEEVVSLTNLSPDQARKAVKREYSEPFQLLADNRHIADLRGVAAQLGLQIISGGRFHHLMGANDKGRATRIIADLFEREYPDRVIHTVGIGDSSNDIAMLNVVSYPIVVQRPDESYIDAHLPPQTLFASGKGPAGWRDGIFQTMKKLGLMGTS